MGCNTSKDWVIPPVEDLQSSDKYNIKFNESENVDRAISNTVEVYKGGSIRASKSVPSEKGTTLTFNLGDLIKDSAEAASAATKIQAVFRGHQTRKNMKAVDRNAGAQKATAASDEHEPTREELEAEFRADDKDVINAATKIQATFRGHMSRKQQADDDAVAVDALADKVDETLDIDLTDPELNVAATKIQAQFRGHKVRKETDGPVSTK